MVFFGKGVFIKILICVVLLFVTSTGVASPNIYIKTTDEMFPTFYLVKNKTVISYTQMTPSKGLGGALIYLFMNRDDFNSTVYWGLFGGGFFTALHYGGKAQSQFYRAINTYN